MTNTKPNQNQMKEVQKLFESNDFVALEKKLKELISSYPSIANLYNILGVVLQKKNDLNGAILNFKKAISIQPNFDQAHNNLGNVLQDTGKIEDAIKSFQNAIKINSKYAGAYSNLGNALSELQKFDEALKNQKEAVKIEPNNPEFNNNLGIALKDLGVFEEAIISYKHAIQINPNYAEAYSNLGNALTELGKIDEALVNYQKSLKLNPKYKKANLNEGLARLALGDFENGWKKYEYRLGEGTNIPIRYPTEKLWRGEYLDGILLVWGEQGLGDHIIFSSMLPDLKRYAKNIILEIDKRLEDLLKRYFEKIKFSNIKIVDSKDKLTDKYDKHIAIGSLGQYLRKSKESFKTTPNKWLITSSEKEKKLRNKFFKNNKFKVGISWGTLNKKQKFRNIDLKEMLPILSNTNCDFIDLQFGKFDEELNNLKNQHDTNIRSINEIDNYNDIDDLASLINCLDLVITIQNSTLHLAGSLGKKTWVMLAKNARWHWVKSEKKSLWYQSVKIFQQEKYGDWKNIIKDVSIELSSLAKLHKN